MTSDQARGLSEIARKYGTSQMRLTVWQNLLIPHIKDKDLKTVKAKTRKLGLDYSASNLRAGLVACTGNAGYKFAGADTKKHAIQIAEYLESKLTLDSPINIQLRSTLHR